jgi:hypothetical protein
MILRYLSNLVSKLLEGFNWLVLEMDQTQWGVVAAILVVVGFMALRTRI